ncbi:MAG: hypothetical protein C4560_02545 [Nitrospiraceae bacterium]|nr:MAG: hypothetical protein C4560_02545 [Nitrospiraceae bacterium]
MEILAPTMPDVNAVQTAQQQSGGAPDCAGCGKDCSPTFSSLVENEMRETTSPPEKAPAQDGLQDVPEEQEEAPEVRPENKLQMADMLLDMLNNIVVADTTVQTSGAEDQGTGEGHPDIIGGNALKNGMALNLPTDMPEAAGDRTKTQGDFNALCNCVGQEDAEGAEADALLSASDRHTGTGGKEMSDAAAAGEIAGPEIEELSGAKERSGKGDVAINATAHARDVIEGLNTREDRKHVIEPFRGLTLNNGKGPDGQGGTEGFADNIREVAKTDQGFDGYGQSNQDIKPESKSAEGPVSGNAARPAGFTKILDNVVYLAKGGSRLGVTVLHDDLGKLDINLSLEKGMLNIHINASDKEVGEFIKNNVQHIVDSLAKDGVSVGGFSVDLKDRNERPEKIFTANSDNNYEKGPVNGETKINAVTGLVSVFA